MSKVPKQFRMMIVVAIGLHFSLLIFLFSTSYRLSTLATETRSLLTPYTVTTNLQLDYIPLAVTNPSELEYPIAIEFRKGGTDQWVRWQSASNLGEGGSIARIRQRRFLAQAFALTEVRSEDGISTLMLSMLKDLQKKSRTSAYDKVRIVQIPLLQQSEWPIAQQLLSSGEIPEALIPEVLYAASIINLSDGSVGIYLEEEDYRTSPVVTAPQ